MVARFCFVYMTFCFVAILVLAIFLRDENSRMFYTLRVGRVEKKQLELQLWQKQLQLENSTNPEEVEKRLALELSLDADKGTGKK